MIDLWLSGRPETTTRSYRQKIGVLWIYLKHIGTPGLMQANLESLSKFIRTLAGRKTSTQAAYIAAIKSFYSYAHDRDWLGKNPAELLPSIRVDQDLTSKYLYPEQVQLLMLHAPDLRSRMALHVLYYGGLRVSEFCNLRIEDIQERDGGRIQISTRGKGGKRRQIVLPPICRELIHQWTKSQAIETGWLVPSGTNKALASSTIYRLITWCAKQAGIHQKISPHTLRHAHASHSLEQGAPIHVVQQTLGHASLATTTRYVHARPGESSGQYLGDTPGKA